MDGWQKENNNGVSDSSCFFFSVNDKTKEYIL